MKTWLLELAAAVGLALAGPFLWSLPSNTPVVGHPPDVIGWVCVVGGIVIAALSTANYFGLEIEVRRKGHGNTAPDPPQIPAAVSPALIPPAGQPANRGPALAKGEFTDASARDLVQLAAAASPQLTAAQQALILAPHKGKWLAVGGVVDDVKQYPSWSIVDLVTIDGIAELTATAYFDKGADPGYDRSVALHKGARIRIRGKVMNATRSGNVSLDACEFID